ncbi:MAG: DNA sulfur modification protein DndD [Desulfuromonadaceae bacterium]|nr:DNA sulfur modification protein DndD [Desulfuromonadaceae bacterium]MDD2854453.1 DNA sulfur modification protein DndD [Desulfuromonadaceae bacterium]
MIFEEIILENFATFKGENSINLLPSSPNKPIILIGGENGCGKTSILDSFQLVLFGPAANCSNRGKLSYDTYLERCINRDTLADEGSRIKLTFQYFSSGVQKRYSIERKWFKKGTKVEKQFSVYELTNDEPKYSAALSDNWSDYVESFFPTQVAHFFFFDGEKIEALADFEKSGHLIHAAIHSLLGLNLVDQLDADLVTLEKRKHKDNYSEVNQGTIESLEVQIQNFATRIDELKIEDSQLNNQYDLLHNRLEVVDMEFRQLGGELFETRFELEKQLQQQREELVKQEDSLREIASGTAPLLLVKHLLRDLFKQSQVEENANREQLLCEVLDVRDQELINRLSGHVAEEFILKDISSYLKEDRDDRREASHAEKYLGLDSDSQRDLDFLLENELPTLEKDIPVAIDKITKFREEVETSELSLGSIPDESKLSAVITERTNLQGDIAKCATSLRVVNEERERAQRQQEQKNAELKRELTRAAHTCFEQKDTQRLVQYASKVRGTLESFRAKVIEKHIGRIESLVLDSFKNLLRKQSLIEQLKIDRENYQVKLYTINGHEVLPERLSAAERQLLATALLWGICQAAGKPLPTIIDTPMGRLDTSHRTNLIENYFPKASHQVLLLSTNEEIVGKYYDKLIPYISQTCLLSNNESNGGTTVNKGYFN